MKKISLFALSLGIGWASFAQNNQVVTPMAVATRFGIKGGVNLSEFKLSSQSSSTQTSTQNKGGFNGGVFANIPLGGSMLRFQPELVYSSQGSKLTTVVPVVPTGSTTYNYDSKLGYLTLPLLLQLQTKSGFFVETGPQAGYLLSAKLSGTGSNNSGETDVKSQMRKLDYGWAGGIGYLSRIGLGIDARYVFGLRNTYNDETGNTMQGESKNRVMQFGLFWQFGAGK